MNSRTAHIFRSGGAMAVVLPADWVRGHGLRPGDSVNLEYDGDVRVRAPPITPASTTGRRKPGGPARRPAHAPEEVTRANGDVD